jgi:sarcosine oxidase delta subunit
MPKLPKIRWGSLRFSCPVCEMLGEEEKEVVIHWDSGSPWTWHEPPLPRSWEWMAGCRHLEEVDRYTVKQVDQIYAAIWQAVEAERMGALEAWAENEYDERRLRKRFDKDEI